MKANLKKYAAVRKTCLRVGVPIPREIADKLRCVETMPPDLLLKEMIEETKALLRGEIFWVEMPQYGMRMQYRLYWDDDYYASLEWMEFKSSKKLTPLEKFLLNRLDWYEEADDMCFDTARNTPEWKAFDKRIKAVCKKSKQWESQYPDFDWDRNVLRVAERR
jgi:hypothetical protein